MYVTATNRGNKKGGQNRDSGSYRCPVYKYPKRTDKYLVFRVDLACDSPSKWKLRGVALLCSTDDWSLLFNHVKILFFCADLYCVQKNPLKTIIIII